MHPKNYYIVNLHERNGDYEYEHIGLIVTKNDIASESERIASEWYDSPSEPDCAGFLFHQGLVSVAVNSVKQIKQEDAKVLIRHLPVWQ